MEEQTRSGMRNKKKRNRTILYIFLVLFLGVYAFFWRAYFDVNKTANTIFNKISTENKRDKPVFIDATEPISFAFLGLDNGTVDREGQAVRSDAIMIGTVNPKTRTTTLVSIPRDTYALMDGYETIDGSLFYDKITHAYAFGQAQMSINSVQELIGVPIDYYVEMNMQGLVDLVDAIGGIEITSPLTFEYQMNFFTEGETKHVDGKEALAFSRMRKDDPEGDYGRQKREKMVIKAIMDKILNVGSLTKFQGILKVLEDNVKTNLSLDDMMNIFTGYGNSLENFEQDTLVGEELWLDEIYYFYVQPTERLRISNLLREQLELPEIEVDDLHLSDTDLYNLDFYSNDVEEW